MVSKSLVVILIGGALFYFFFLRGGQGDPLPQNFKKVSAELIKKQQVIGIDVRSPGEVQSNPAEGALHIPMGDFENEASNLEKDKHYVVFCETGMRASVVIKQMKSMGFKKVSNIRDWRAWNRLKEK